MLKASLPQMSKDFSLRRIFDQTCYIIKENVVKNGGPIIDVCTGAPPDVVTALPLSSHKLLLLLHLHFYFNHCCNFFVCVMFCVDCREICTYSVRVKYFATSMFTFLT